MKEKDLKTLKIGTRAIAATHRFDFSQVRSHVAPLFQTINFEYADAEEGLAILEKEKPGYIYTRTSNPTTDLFGRVVSILEESEAYAVAGSGMAAISAVFLALLKPGDHVVASANIYGGARTWLRDQLTGLDMHTSFVDITDPEQILKAINARTRVLYTEVLGNPNLTVSDIPMLAKIARDHNLRLVVDNTFTPPPIFQPLKWGVDVVIHSATKYLSGHGDLIGGVVVCSEALAVGINRIIEMYGSILSPFNAWLALRGIKTLGIRLERQCANAEALAQFLQSHPKVIRVNYPGLAEHPQALLAKKILNGFGGMLSFEVRGGLDAGKKVMNAVQVCNFTVSLGEIDTLIIHPATTSHVGLSPEERQAIGVTDGLMRLSVGIEDIDDLLADLQQALDQI